MIRARKGFGLSRQDPEAAVGRDRSSQRAAVEQPAEKREVLPEDDFRFDVGAALVDVSGVPAGRAKTPGLESEARSRRPLLEDEAGRTIVGFSAEGADAQMRPALEDVLSGQHDRMIALCFLIGITGISVRLAPLIQLGKIPGARS